jgi:hypothetical protein
MLALAMSKPEITLHDTVVVSPQQVSTELGSETVILGVEAGRYFGLNEVGARIWSLLQAPRRVSELCDAIQEEYDVTQAECTRDVLELLHELNDKGLIDVQPAVGAP